MDKWLCRVLMAALVATVLANDAKSGEPTVDIDVAKTSSCGCCLAWIDHLKKNEFSVTDPSRKNKTFCDSKTKFSATDPSRFFHDGSVTDKFIFP